MDMLIEKQKKIKEKLSKVQAKKLLINKKTLMLKEKLHLCEEKLMQVENKLSSEQTLSEDLLIKNGNIYKQKIMAEMTSISEKVKFDAKIKLMKEYRQQFEDWSENINTVKQTAISQRKKLENVNVLGLVTKKDELKLKIAGEIEERKQILNLVDEVETACNILKKRNNAVLILLRKNLQDSELKRRDIMQKLNARKKSTLYSVN